MYFYLALADRVVVGGGFNPRGAHNVIEPLALSKPVWTGPHTWTIEYPFVEAEAAGVAASVPDAAALARALQSSEVPSADRMAAFVQAHSGAVARTMEALAPLLDAKVAI
jgi:3-deoxy-D-manno-octulosonic-acid transferase